MGGDNAGKLLDETCTEGSGKCKYFFFFNPKDAYLIFGGGDGVESNLCGRFIS